MDSVVTTAVVRVRVQMRGDPDAFVQLEKANAVEDRQTKHPKHV